MRYFNNLSEEEETLIFHKAPVPFDNRADRELLSHALGAALYMPATRQTISEDILTGKYEGLVTVVLDLEDAVGDQHLQVAEESIRDHLRRLSTLLHHGLMTRDQLPLLFIRVRAPEQLTRMIAVLEDTIELVAGFVLPKFSVLNGRSYLSILREYHLANPALPLLYAMPILESSSVIYCESRRQTLIEIKQLLDEYRPYILNVRIGATDFSSLFGLRRSPDMTIYDIGVIRDCITDIINLFGRMEDSYVVSGPVWEYFKSERVLKPQLRQTPFEESAGRLGRRLRMQYINVYVDGLIREVAMDKENGIIGKTIIHPSHIRPVQALYAVTHEEYVDAVHIIANNNGLLGVMKSEYSNKMNEIKPHMNWARRIMIRSEIYGVLHENQNFTALLIGKNEYEQAFI
ncbi:HpcH/HpaI aldolase/citrate lyase family protein [Paenibacillus sp. ACRRX]|uniref:HpcH/HpaI aldolase/citrate lyase family protein n=1 Tax=unclassified Paenibacillus TaxID=185978 RepID=UPI001EF57577|nr:MULTISPECIES: HpcH/HpaI aldolase/citrate lyase family protein [unclassified Paenibacillus]MCG7409682.1 HpcH/HpaI aldolase/citrate lyase family protein [Paenibacillus sp. ACRRX]MDK8183240.1 HpcH/HpaI aldolase/citrate lyase family protein [Paenibacillus sp. UMB4589-SE434]